MPPRVKVTKEKILSAAVELVRKSGADAINARTLADEGMPHEVIDGLRDAIDCNVYFFENKVNEGVMFFILGGSVLLLIAVYVVMNVIATKKVRATK